MKKLIFTIFVVVSLVLLWRFWPHLKFWSSKIQKLPEMVQNSPTIAAIKEQVLTGGALRGKEDSPNARLTVAGVISFTNQERAQNGGLPRLKENLKLDAAAKAKLDDMFKNQYFEHISPSGAGPSDLAKQAGYDYVVVGENLALGNFKDDSSLVTAWMNSPGHRANILNGKYEEIGVAVGQGMFEGKKVWLAVQEFGKPVSSCPAIDANLKTRIDSLKADIAVTETQLKLLKAKLDSAEEPKNQKEVDSYNEVVSQYNSLVKSYNNKLDLLKAAVSEYNGQVQSFNQCAS